MFAIANSSIAFSCETLGHVRNPSIVKSMSLGHHVSGFTVPMFDTVPTTMVGAAFLSGALSCLLSAGALSSEIRNFGLKLITLDVEPVDDVALFPQFDKLICHFVSKLLDSDL